MSSSLLPEVRHILIDNQIGLQSHSMLIHSPADYQSQVLVSPRKMFEGQENCSPCQACENEVLKIYATHLFVPTELHSGTDGPSLVV